MLQTLPSGRQAETRATPENNLPAKERNMTTITRDRNRGILSLSIDGPPTPTVLRGGGYDLFFNPGASIKALAAKNTEDPIHVEYALGKNPCQTNFNIAVEYAPWHEGTNSFVEFFSAMQAQHCNLVRVFLS